MVPVSTLVLDARVVVLVAAEATVQSRAVPDAEVVRIAARRTVEGVAALHAEVDAADIVIVAQDVVEVVQIVQAVQEDAADVVEVAAILAVPDAEVRVEMAVQVRVRDVLVVAVHAAAVLAVVVVRLAGHPVRRRVQWHAIHVAVPVLEDAVVHVVEIATAVLDAVDTVHRVLDAAIHALQDV